MPIKFDLWVGGAVSDYIRIFALDENTFFQAHFYIMVAHISAKKLKNSIDTTGITGKGDQGGKYYRVPHLWTR